MIPLRNQNTTDHKNCRQTCYYQHFRISRHNAACLLHSFYTCRNPSLGAEVSRYFHSLGRIVSYGNKIPDSSFIGIRTALPTIHRLFSFFSREDANTIMLILIIFVKNSISRNSKLFFKPKSNRAICAIKKNIAEPRQEKNRCAQKIPSIYFPVPIYISI